MSTRCRFLVRNNCGALSALLLYLSTRPSIARAAHHGRNAAEEESSITRTEPQQDASAADARIFDTDPGGRSSGISLEGGAEEESSTTSLPKVGHLLSSLYEERQEQLAQHATERLSPDESAAAAFAFAYSSEESLLIRDGTHVHIEAAVGPPSSSSSSSSGDTTNTDALLAELTSLGFEEEASYGRMIAGWFPIDAVPQLSAVGDVGEGELLRFVEPATPPRLNAGSVQSEGVKAMMADVAADTFGVDGDGVTVGVISDSYNCTGGADRDIASGDLPSEEEGGGVVILSDPCPGWSRSDEGRAMMQLIHDVAPKAKLVFHTAGNSEAAFANAILNLAFDARSMADVIVDDIGFLAEPMFQDGLISQAIDEVAGQGVAYFCAAGNMGQNSWESEAGFIGYNPFGPEYNFHNFNTGMGRPAYYQEIIVPVVSERSRFLMTLQWDEPYYSASSPNSPNAGSASNVDVLVWDFNDDYTLLRDLINNRNNTGGDPYEYVSLRGKEVNRAMRLGIAFVLRDGGPPPSFLKYIIFSPHNPTIVDYPTHSGTCIGHAYARGGASLGAAAWTRTPAFGIAPALRQTFSSPCGFPVLFDVDGVRLDVPEYRRRPTLVGPDGTQTTFFGSQYAGDDGGINFYFSGTSAAAPHVAGVAALMLQASAMSIGPSVVYDILGERTATNMGVPGFDFLTGHGFVNASLAVEMAATYKRQSVRDRFGSYSLSGRYDPRQKARTTKTEATTAEATTMPPTPTAKPESRKRSRKKKSSKSNTAQAKMRR